ncbi:MAG: PIG-L family deacetylase, partial [Limisphaerales bacterium]
IFFPHRHDWNGTHIGVHFLLLQALRQLGDSLRPFICETEFWGQMQSPNLAIESSAKELGDLINALAYHVGEVQRNPYHLSLPAWMIDNTRRGYELVGGQGKSGPSMQFATLYRRGRWDGANIVSDNEGAFLCSGDDPATLFTP